MLNAIIRFALRQRVLAAALSFFLVVYGGWQIYRLPIDVFPDLNRPRVVVMTEAPGMAPEEVEALITFPLETALNGATDVQAVRSASGVGISSIYVEFDWGTDIYNDRQVVAERLALVTGRLPEGISPQLAPVSSVMGQIMIVGMWSDDGRITPMEMRTTADWVIRQRLLTIPGVSQVFVMGGERKQFQVLISPDALLRWGVTLGEIKTALKESNQNATGGYLDEQGPEELLVRSVGRIQSIDDLKEVVVTIRDGRPLLLEQVARVVEGPQVKRGDSSAFARGPEGQFSGGPAVILTINKQPKADTRLVTREITAALAELESRMPEGIRINTELYQQKSFIDRAVENVVEALWHGGFLVLVILFLFLMNLRTTFITLTAIPVSIAITGLVFAWFGLSINTMTLGGLAIAIGELVDDAIVDVENIFRRLKENRHAEKPRPAILVVFQASAEIRNSIVFGTVIVMLVFIPVFSLGGMEGRLFRPLGIAYIVSIGSSLLVSLTLTPVLSYWLLPGARSIRKREEDGLFLAVMKWAAGRAIGLSLRFPLAVIGVTLMGVAAAGWAAWNLQSDFLPPFNEGAVQINVISPPGTSLATSSRIARDVEQRLKEIPDLESFVRKTGRAELDEHAVTVNVTEIIATLRSESGRGRGEILDDIRHAMEDITGIQYGVEQPLQHLISHMLSGVQAQVAIKLYGGDLGKLRETAQRMKDAIADVEGVEDLLVEPQAEIPQLRISIDGHKLQRYGLRRAQVNDLITTAMHGEVISEVLLDKQTFDLLLRLEEADREDLEVVKRLSIALPGGGTTMLQSVARIDPEASGPNSIRREKMQPRIAVQCNVAGRGLVDVVRDIKQRLEPIAAELPDNYFIEYGGQFESQQSASRRIGVLFAVSLVGMFLVLYTMFRSVNLSLQVMVALPMAFIGSVAALWITGQTLTVAAMVGFISLSGIASRNGILLISHYLHLVEYERESWSRQMVIRAGQQRLAPVLMTALTSGIGLLPLALAAGEPGKEILYPVATVIIGGLISSTLLEFFVRPALFWRFGIGAAKRVLGGSGGDVRLVEESAAEE